VSQENVELDGVRRFWGEFLGRVARVQSFADPDGARQAAGLP
jgi:hypothetical protein